MRKMVEVDILALLDRLEAFRRRCETDPPPVDNRIRILEAFVAELGGYSSRPDWVEALIDDPESEYSEYIKKGRL